MGCLSLHDWATEYLNYAEASFVIKTYKEKKSAFKRLIGALGDIPVQDITTHQAWKFLMRESETRSGNAANKDRKNLAVAWKFGIQYIENFPNSGLNPFTEVMKFREIRQPRYIPSAEDFWKLYNLTKG